MVQRIGFLHDDSDTQTTNGSHRFESELFLVSNGLFSLPLPTLRKNVMVVSIFKVEPGVVRRISAGK